MWRNWAIGILAIWSFVLTIVVLEERNVAFSDLLQKVANGDTLSPSEKDELLLEARRLEEIASLVNSIVQPGSSSLKIDSLTANNAEINDAVIQDATINRATAGDGTVLIDTLGVMIENNSLGAFALEDNAGNRDKIIIAVDDSNRLHIQNKTIPASASTSGLWQRIAMTSGEELEMVFIEDPAQAERPYWRIQDGDQGTRFVLGNDALVDFRTEGASGGSTFMRLRETTTTPPAPSTDAFHMYMKGDKLIIQAGSGTYFYLDLTASSNQSWIYSSTAP